MFCTKHLRYSPGSCSLCVHDRAKEEKADLKANEKRLKTLEKAKKKALEKKPGISKNPSDWKNTFLCSDGTKLTQTQISNRLKRAYKKSAYTESLYCLGCGNRAQGHAHIISQARCKRIGKTELIWNPDNYFEACNACNMAIENPKGRQWKYLKNIDQCLLFIKEHDPQLFIKFELSAVNQERPTI